MNKIYLIILLWGVAGRGLAQSSTSVDQRVESLLSQMSLDEKIGQMVQVDMNALKDNADIQKYYLGSMLSGGNSDPADNRPETWLQGGK